MRSARRYSTRVRPHCSIEGCPRFVRRHGYHLCWIHDTDRARCTVAGCRKPEHALGLCSAHYWAVKREGEKAQAEREAYPTAFNMDFSLRL